jgi:Ca-activated chloride channel homolog
MDSVDNHWTDVWGPLDWLHPEYLLLAPVGLAVIFLIEWRAQGVADAVQLGPGRRWITRVFRGALILLLTFALAGLCLVRSDNTLSVLFCLDRSASMEQAKQEWALDWIRQAMGGMGADDRAGVLVFGSDSNIEIPLQRQPDLLEPRTVVDREFTNLAGVLRLAQAHFPGGTQRKIVVLTDGRENFGDVLAEGLIARSNGVPVTTVHCETAPAAGEVLIDSLLAPERVDKDEPFAVRVILVSGKEQQATLYLQRGESEVQSLPLTLKAGRNVIELPQRLESADVHVFKARVEAAEDENPLNNVSWALTEVLGKTRVLLIDREPASLLLLEMFLKKAGLEVDRGGPSALPIKREELARYDGVILSDVPATVFSREQINMLEVFVKDLGGGLGMLGGTESFGLGGYFGTGIEKVLPVDCDIRNKEDLPSLGLVFCIDRSGSMSASQGGMNHLELAKEGVRRTIDLLYKKDKIGILGFDSSSDWVLPLNVLESKLAMERALATMSPGGGTAIYPALTDAYKALSKSGTDLKHLILLTDGRSAAGDYESALADCRRGKISISTVGIGESIDKDLLEWLAETGQGRFFHARDSSELPRIFTKDALTASRSLLVEKSFVPVQKQASELFQKDAKLPPLHGFVLTTAKKEAEVLLSSTAAKEGKTDGPILVRWRVGLGKGLAYTSQFKKSWGRDWQDWRGLEDFWVRTVQWLCKDRRENQVNLDVQWRGGEGIMTVETPSRQDEFLDLRTRIVAPAGSPKMSPVKLSQVAPGRYEGRFPALRTGVYLVTAGVFENQQEQVLATRGVVMSYPREYKDLSSNAPLLRRLSELTGGQAYSLTDIPQGVFERTGKAERSLQDIWPWLVFFASLLFVCDVALRRIDLRAFFSNLKGRQKPKEADEEVFKQLMSRKASLKKQMAVHSKKRDSVRQAASSGAMKAVTDVSPPKSAFKSNAAPSSKTQVASTKASVTPPKKTAKPPTGAEQEIDYTSRLLAAKKRARGDSQRHK